jgi:hypothetical protein
MNLNRNVFDVRCDWRATPQIQVYRKGELVGTAELHHAQGAINGRNIHPMTRDEWGLVKIEAMRWAASNPRPR